MIRLRPAEPQDDYVFYQLRKQEDPITWEEHQKWWATFEHRFVAYDGPVLVGIIRITPVPTLETLGILSILVAKTERGKGFGTQMLTSIQRVARDLGLTKLIAEVDAKNIASRHAFSNAGYLPTRFETEDI